MNNSQKAVEDDLGIDGDSAAQPNLALLFNLTEQEQTFKKRRKKLVAVLIAGLAILGTATFLLLRAYYSAPDAALQINNQTISPAPLTVKSEQVSGDYVLKKLEFSESGERALAVDLYDFDANRFIKGKDKINNQQLLESLLDDKREALKDSMIVIFTGASFEGKSDDNRELTRRRACYVGNLLTQKLQIDSNLVWMLAAGEYKSSDFAGIDEEIKEDSIRDSPNSESILGVQRRLILVTLPFAAESATKQKSPGEVLNNLIKLLREQNLLPTSYDHGLQSEPALMSKMDCNR